MDRILFCIMAMCFGAVGWTDAAETHADRLPNVIIVLADDLGYGDLGCYSAKSKIPTPHLDRLAGQGMRFTDAHTPSSVCSPTRYGLLTGRYCWRTPLKQSVLWPWDAPLIKRERLTLPGMLKQHGYHTACIGKWHLGWEWATRDGSRMNDTVVLGKYDRATRAAFGKKIDFTKRIKGGPLERGFDYYFGDDVPNFPPYCFIENDHTIGVPSEEKPKEMFGLPGPMLSGWDLTAVMPALAKRAVDYIDSQAKAAGETPFFLYLPLTAPHTPIAPTNEFIGRSRAGRYGDFVHEVDWVVGQVVEAVERNDLAKETLIVFTSDNGSPGRDGTKMNGTTQSVVKEYGHHPSGPWRGMKGDIWEGGHRVPLIVRWPGRIEAKAVSGELTCLTDLMATVAQIVGHKLPADAGEDSLSILPLLRGETPAKPIRRSIVHHSLHGTFAVREGDWKLVVDNLGSGGFTAPAAIKPKAGEAQGQLYNLADDPAEQNNLWSARPEIVERLTELLERIRRGD